MIKRSLLIGLIGLVGSSTAAAGDFYFEFGSGGYLADGDISGSGSTRTPDYEQLGASATQATSIYSADSAVAIGPGTDVIDTNRSDVLATYSFGGSITTPDDAARSVTALVPGQGTAESNNFSPSPVDWDEATDDDFWGMTFDYDLSGEITSGSGTDLNNAGVDFTSGTFDYFFEYQGESLQVLSVDVTGSRGTIANLILEGEVNFDFLGEGSFSADEEAFIQNFFRDSASGESFYALATGGAEVPISWRLDTNVDEDVTLVEGTDGDDNTVLARQTELDNSVRFQVPEPSALMLLGLGLVGLGVVAHRRRRSDVSNLAA